MNSQTFITKLKDFSSRYKEWWFKPLKVFQQEFLKEHPNFIKEINGVRSFNPSELNHYWESLEEFEKQRRSQNDLIVEIYDFIDQNYDVYLNATPQECEEIRKVSDSYYEDYIDRKNYFLRKVLFQYADHAIDNLKTTGKKEWLLRGLVALSIEDCGTDYRDTIVALRKLKSTAWRKFINPKSSFLKVAEVSSHEVPSGGFTPMYEMMRK